MRSDPSQKRLDTSIVIPGATSLAIVLIGFVALSALYLNYLHGNPESSRGLFSFRSATVGDGILIPAFVFCGLREILPIRSLSGSAKRALAVGATLGALGGICTQALWLLSGSTRLNWTFEKLHTFNFAGWYHGAFLTVLTAVCAALLACSAQHFRDRHIQRPSGPLLGQSNIIGMLTVGFGFCGLLTLDTYDSHFALRTVWIPSAALLTVIIISSYGMHFRNPRSVVKLTLATALPGAMLCLPFYPGNHYISPLPLVGLGAFASGVAVAALPRREAASSRVLFAILLGCCPTGPILFVSARYATPLPLAAGIIGGTIMLALEVLLLSPQGATGVFKRRAAYLAACSLGLFGLTGIYFFKAPDQIARLAAWAGAGQLILSLFLVAPWLSGQFEPVIEAETTGLDPEELAARKFVGYQALAAASLSAAAFLAVFVIGSAPDVGWSSGAVSVTILIADGVALTCLLALELVVRSRSERSAFSIASVALAVFAIAWTFGQIALILTQWRFSLPSLLVGLTVGSVVATFTFDSLISNVFLLQGRQFAWRAFVPFLLASTANGVAVVFLSTVGMQALEHPTSLLGAVIQLVVACFIFARLGPLTASAFTVNKSGAGYVPAPPLNGALQDAFMCALLTAFVAWLPLLVLTHVSAPGSWAAVVFAYATVMGYAFSYVLKNNVKHLESVQGRRIRMAREGDVPIEADELHALRHLRRHIFLQNLLAMIAIVPLSIFAFAQIAAELGGFRQVRLRSVLLPGRSSV